MTESLPKSVWTVLTTMVVGWQLSPPLTSRPSQAQVQARVHPLADQAPLPGGDAPFAWIWHADDLVLRRAKSVWNRGPWATSRTASS